MTGQRAAREPYTTRFETEVTSIDGRTVWLETSYFYGTSDGQPADRGTVGDATVTDVRLVDGEQAHVLAEEPSFRVGRRVLCSIDWSFRMYCMRAHTAAHLCYGAARRCLDSPGYAGLEIGEETVAVDLETAPLDDEALIQLDELINRTVWESRPVSWESVPVAAARERDDVVFDEERSGTAVEKGRVRVVTIGDENDTGHGMATADAGEPWNVAACGGTHVRNTREVGPVTVLGCSSPAEGIRRLEFAVGPQAIDRRTAEKRAAFAASAALDVDLEDVGDELERA
ncbi:alanyl-tRNA editing protein [Haloterrigena sp. SYSU A558-1]|uniref:Alanyl-tRNA editing protein n=1 Tax=Haloterrigena gelatinilytica TaxID=2741724 RepID=A0ABX2L4H0_9EURY|nr:alanyl-tRNA editing protein [Haloterrigena gelatinilytica]NUC71172.1 alanyl-tRNA editing protein [Haloterrigena gelatinilytica]